MQDIKLCGELETLRAASFARPLCHIATRIIFNEQFLPRAFRQSHDPIREIVSQNDNEYWRDVAQARAVGLILLAGGGIRKQ